MMNMMYAAFPMRAQTEKTTFSCKDDCTLTKHTRRWTYSPLHLQYDLCRTSYNGDCVDLNLVNVVDLVDFVDLFE